MDPIIIERSWPGGSTLEVEPLRGTTFTEESGAHQFRISGVGTGTILAKFLRADDYTIDISGSVEDGAAVITLVSDYASLLERTQSLPILQRLNFFECTYIVFSFLRLNGQLRRCVERFDETCADDLHQMIKRLYEGL